MTQSKIPFDMEAALKALREGQPLNEGGFTHKYCGRTKILYRPF